MSTSVQVPKIIVSGAQYMKENVDSFFIDLASKYKIPHFSSSGNSGPNMKEVCINIKTKYYSCKADLVQSVFGDNSCTRFGHEDAEALIYVSELLNETHIATVTEILTESKCALKVLACTSLSDALFEEVMKMCISADVELVDLTSQEDENEEFPEKHGINRIVEILETHLWPNLEKASEVSTPDDPEPVPFEELFAKFAAMKTTADKLDPQSRKLFAESVVSEFWKAIGGPCDELDSSDEG